MSSFGSVWHNSCICIWPCSPGRGNLCPSTLWFQMRQGYRGPLPLVYSLWALSVAPIFLKTFHWAFGWSGSDSIKFWSVSLSRVNSHCGHLCWWYSHLWLRWKGNRQLYCPNENWWCCITYGRYCRRISQSWHKQHENQITFMQIGLTKHIIDAWVWIQNLLQLLPHQRKRQH